MANLIFLLISIYFAVNISYCTKLNYPRVLLPIFDKISINFTLEVIEKGCVKWVSSRQDLIQITPLYENADSECSSKAVVTVLTKEKRRNTAIVLAENLNSGEFLRCDVILDVIDQFGILTTTRELYLEEAPETFELWAQDSQGNAFTTLEGVEFNWQVSQTQSNEAKRTTNWQQVLRFLTFTESKYHEVPSTLEKFESAGIKGYMVLLEAINTGTAKVSVRMLYPEYSNVDLIEVDIMVLANIILDPSDVHVMVGDTVNFRILQLKQGKLQEISLNNQYYLEIENKVFATISGKSATGLKLGSTKVVLRDRNVPSEHNFKSDNGGDYMKAPVPTATLIVSEPNKMTINLLPHYNWLTVEGEKHEIAVDLYTIDDQKIFLGPKYKMKSEFDESLFYPIKRTLNGSRIYGEALKEGKSPVHGSFNKLSAKANLQVYPELILTPSLVILPYDPNAPKSQKVLFSAKGGDGAYAWSSQNPNIIQIYPNGLAETKFDLDKNLEITNFDTNQKSILTKHTNIRVSLARNIKLFRSAEIYFLPPVKLEIVKYNFETSLHDYVKLHIALYTYVNNTNIPFTRCENLNFDYEFTNQIFHLDASNKDVTEENLAPNACFLVYLKSSSIGTTNLKLSYRFGNKVLYDEVTLMVFEKLSILNPILNEIILPIGATRNLIYTNGPQQIFNLDAELIKNFAIDNEISEITEINVSKSKSMYVFEVLCKKIGETNFEFELHNSLITKNFSPYLSKFTTKIFCVKPRFINLYAIEELRQSCPLEMKNSLVQIKDRDEQLEIQIDILDAKNRKLMNISSLVIDWEFSQSDLKYQKDISYYRDNEEEIIETIRIPGKDFLSITISEIVTNFKIKGVVSKYDTSIISKHRIIPEIPNFGVFKSKTGKYIKPIIENEVNFMAVNSTLFPFDNISIFMSKNRIEKIPIAQGSGFYEFVLSENGIISVEYDTKSRQLVIIPLKIGYVMIELIDRCLMAEPARLSVSVVTIGSIKIEAPEYIEKTKTVEAFVKLYDSNQNLLIIDSNDLKMYELNEEIFHSEILTAKLGEQNNLEIGEIRYLLTGNELGETKIIFHSGYDLQAITSSPANIQVFPPLRLYPRNSTIVVGSSIQIYYQGGPHPDVNIVYSVHNQNIVSMDSALILAKKLGKTEITGKCIGVNTATGKQIIFSEDKIEVFVVAIEKIQIHTPLLRIKSGAVMPASVWGGVPELSPMILGTLENIKVIWSTNQPDVVDIYGIFTEAGIEYSDSDLITVRVKALNPGKAKIQANFILPNGKKLTSTIEVTVFKILQLESPKPITMDSILIAPRSTIQLKANLDNVVYKLDTTMNGINENGGNSGSGSGSNNNGIIKVTSDGIVKSSETLGRDLIIAKTFEQTLPIDIEVKNVQYILTSLEHPSIKLKQIEDKIPRGMNIILKISLHDNLGNEFSHNIEDVHTIRYDLSHKDMVDIQIANNLTVAINLPRETNNMIAIALKDPNGVKYAEDYIKVSVAESKNIFPRIKTILSVGDIICFDSPLSLTTQWTSSDEHFVTIDKFTGVATVLANRYKLSEKIVITNGDKAGSYIKYDLDIREADKIEFFKSYDIFSGSTYNGYLVIRNHFQIDKFNNLISKNISKCSNYVDRQTSVKFFKCSLTSKQQLGNLILENYEVTAIFDKDNGMYACVIEIVTSISAVMNLVKSMDVNIELEAQLPNGIADSVTLKIVPGIKVSPDAISVDQISQQGIIITGLDKVLQKIEVKTSDATILEVIPQAKTHGSLQYKVKLLNELPLEEQLFVEIHSPLTQQNIQIPISGPNALVQKCSSQPFSNSSAFFIKLISNLGLILSTLICLSAAVWVSMFGLPGRRQTSINSEAFSTSLKNRSNVTNVSGVSALDLSSSGGNNPCGPTYPYPFNGNRSGANQSFSNESTVYGDSANLSPLTRRHRRNF